MSNKTDVMTEDQTLEFLNPEGEENEDDIESKDQRSYDKAVVSGTDWTTETILSQLRQGHILLNPHFQRREAWTLQRQSRFIESLFMGLPVPQIVLAESKRHRGKYIVIDGKQRLLSLLHFAGSDVAKVQPLKLTGLKIRKNLDGKTYAEMKADATLDGDLARFQNETIRTVVLRTWPNEDYIYLVFLRLNTESVKLSPQELRQALHPGEFIDFAITRSAQSKQLFKALKLSEPDFRMRDVEVFVRYFAFQYFLSTYDGNLKKFLDNTCQNLNNSWEKWKDEIEEKAYHFDEAIETVFCIFKNNAFKKWNKGEYEKRFNRAIFDVMIYFLSDEKIRVKARSEKKKVEDAFRSLCENNDDFIKAIEVTTKSIVATRNRLTLWGKSLSHALGVKIALPKVGE